MNDPYYEKLIEIAKQFPPNTWWEHIELAIICAVLIRHNGNRSAAAKDLELSVRTIRNKIHDARKYGFEPIENTIGRPKNEIKRQRVRVND